MPTPNPKDLFGAVKVPLRYIPFSAIMELGRAMRDGIRPRKNLPRGYGPFNWRQHPVDNMVYYEAATRHMALWMEGQTRDPKSNAHHLGHAMACMGIIIDSESFGNVIDTRPTPNPDVIAQLSPDVDPFAPDWTKPEQRHHDEGQER